MKYPFIYIGMFFGLLTACGPDAVKHSAETSDTVLPEKVIVVVEAANFSASDGKIDVAKQSNRKGYISAAGETWLAYDVEIPTAGRYEVRILASPEEEGSTVWIEDYVGNPDDRTYNITGTIALDSLSTGEGVFQYFTKVGSPLNAGLHKIKVHTNGAMQIDKIEFELVRAHQFTPEIITQNMSGENLTLVWSDEFDGTTIDTSKWTFDIGNWGWGNNELQYYTENRPENARIEDGNLVIEAHKDDMGQAWTSARLTTRGKISFVYGRIAFRARVPKEKGNWAAGWTLGDNYIDEFSWPYCGEIDILESVGYEMDDATGDGIAHASAHCGAYYFKLGNQPTGTIPVKNMNEEFHIYAIDWSPEGMTASVDGVEYFTYDDTSSDLSWPFDKPQNIILNLAMGGGWGGLMGMDESVTSQRFIVDYVRVYEKSDE